jgi:ubiquinone/menaquinone biosynthesis C-methylase UbiE
MEVSSELKNAYSGQYSGSEAEWRMLGAKYKALNIIELAEGIDPKKVCEVGCGEGSILQWLSDSDFAEKLYGIDISESGIDKTSDKKIKNVVELRVFDGYSIPYPDKFFDLVVCSHVIEHVEHPRILLREIKRISKKQIFEVPIDFSFYVNRKAAHYLAYGHINIFTPGLFNFLLLSENFSILKEKHYFYPDEISKYLYKNKIMKRFTQNLKQFILKNIGYLRGIKPSSYAVLTEQNINPVQIMQH